MTSEAEDNYEYSSDEDASFDDDEDMRDEDESMDKSGWIENGDEGNSSNAIVDRGTKAFQKPIPVIRMVACDDLKPEMKSRVDDLQEMLGISKVAATVLMHKHQWQKDGILECFMYDSDNTLKQAGVFFRVSPLTRQKQKGKKVCSICYDEVESMLAMPCSHEFCHECWSDFAVTAVDDGPACVIKTCPQFKCNEIVTEVEMAQALAAKTKELNKYYTYQLRSFVESNPLTRWCPGPGCERVAYASNRAAIESEGSFVTCDSCSTPFCLVCGNEPHAPTTCKELAMWEKKCADEAETANWMMANTKCCPKCVTRIEKNQGCNHMTCRQCRWEFCWICMGDWKEHRDNYNCNRYKEGQDNDDSDKSRAKRELERYLHYYRRYKVHDDAEKFAKKQLITGTQDRMKQLQDTLLASKWSDVEFLLAANEKLVECRRVLKFSYVFAFYLPKYFEKQRVCFENHQEMLARFTEGLSEVSEKPLAEMDRTDVVNQTRVIDKFIKNILQHVEDGME